MDGDRPPDDRPLQRRRTGAGGAGEASKSDEEYTLSEEERDWQELDEDQVQDMFRDLSIADVPDEVLKEAMEYLEFNQQQAGAPAVRWTGNEATEVIVLAMPSDGPLPPGVYHNFPEALLAYKSFREQYPNRLFTIRLRMRYGTLRAFDSSEFEFESDDTKSFRGLIPMLSPPDAFGELNLLRILTKKKEIILEHGNMSVIYEPNQIRIRKYEFADADNLISVTPPERLREIGESAFSHCRRLISFTFPSSLRKISEKAFENSNLMSVDLSMTTLSTIDEDVFRECTALKSVKFPNSLRVIEHSAFYNCYQLTSVNLSQTSLTRIGKYAFYHCIALTLVTFPEGLTSIGGRAFYECSGLTSVTLPEGLRKIGMNAFHRSGVRTVFLSLHTVQESGALPSGADVTFYDLDSDNDELEPKSARRDDWSGPSGGAAGGAAGQFCVLRF